MSIVNVTESTKGRGDSIVLEDIIFSREAILISTLMEDKRVITEHKYPHAQNTKEMDEKLEADDMFTNMADQNAPKSTERL